MINKELIEQFNVKLTEKRIKIFCAESITAGLLSSTIASISGASSVLLGSIVSYNIDIKESILNVPTQIINEFSAESIQVSQEMTKGLIELKLKADILVSITGAASKLTDNSEYKQIVEQGCIFLSIYYMNEFFNFSHKIDSEDRNYIREKTVEYILETILQIIS